MAAPLRDNPAYLSAANYAELPEEDRRATNANSALTSTPSGPVYFYVSSNVYSSRSRAGVDHNGAYAAGTHSTDNDADRPTARLDGVHDNLTHLATGAVTAARPPPLVPRGSSTHNDDNNPAGRH